MYDYLIVGCGLAGIAFAETALSNNKTVFVINDSSQNASKVAGGLYNPVILKRFTEVWQAKEQLYLAHQFYLNLSSKLNFQCDFQLPLYRKFHSIEEQNNWFIAADKPNLVDFLDTQLISNSFSSITAPFGFGQVLHSGHVATAPLVAAYQSFLTEQNLYLAATFKYSQLKVADGFVEYQNLKAKHIVFAEGFGMLLNPFFSVLPLDGTKGELLLIKAPNLHLNAIVNSAIFILPLGNDLYKVGATYNWEDKSNTPTDEAKSELIKALKELIRCDFEIMAHYAGVRPTVKDRRPLVGTHPKYRNLHVLNGLGTRGVMLAPMMAKNLYESIEKEIPLEKTIDIKRIKGFLSSFCHNE